MKKKLMVLVALVMATISLFMATGASAATYNYTVTTYKVVLTRSNTYSTQKYTYGNKITAVHTYGAGHTVVDVTYAKNFNVRIQNSLGKTSYSSLVGSAYATGASYCASQANVCLVASKTSSASTMTIPTWWSTGKYRYEAICYTFACTFKCYKNGALVTTVNVTMPRQSTMCFQMYRYANI